MILNDFDSLDFKPSSYILKKNASFQFIPRPTLPTTQRQIYLHHCPLSRFLSLKHLKCPVKSLCKESEDKGIPMDMRICLYLIKNKTKPHKSKSKQTKQPYTIAYKYMKVRFACTTHSSVHVYIFGGKHGKGRSKTKYKCLVLKHFL